MPPKGWRLSIARDEKPCRICGVTKPITEFHRRASSADGHHSACKPCAIAEQTRSNMVPRSLFPDGPKLCVRCREMRSPEEFPRNASRWDGRGHTCKRCLKTAYDADPNGKADIVLRARYRLRLGWYEEMLAQQDGRCAICRTADHGRKRRFSIDHSHGSGAVRGLLCDLCNKGLGHFRDSPELLRLAAAYLENPPSEHPLAPA